MNCKNLFISSQVFDKRLDANVKCRVPMVDLSFLIVIAASKELK